MPNPELPADTRVARTPSSRTRFQFSLLWLMVAVTVVALLLGLGSYVGSVFGLLRFVLYFAVRCVVPTPLVICAVFGRRHVRAFAIGALVPWLTTIPWQTEQESLISLLITLILSAICGFVATATWRWLQGINPA